MDNKIIIREATLQDISLVVDFYMRLDHSGQKNWIEIMMDGRHPYVNASNFIIAVDLDNGKLVASVIYMPWTYSYGGSLIKAVRLEEVFCEPSYQNQGLVKSILRRISEISIEKGYMFEVVYGTNAVYNHFSYTYGLPNEEEGYNVISENETVGTDFTICEANDDDIPIIAELYKTNYTRNLLTTAIGCKEIHYTKNVYVAGNYYVIKSLEGKICGFFHTQLEDKRVYMMELDDTVSYYQIRPYLLDFYKQHGLNNLILKLGKSHPVYSVFKGFNQKKLLSELGFVKIYDIPRFLMYISHILGERLEKSSYSHYTGKFVIAMHNKDEAYRLEWIDGNLSSVTPVHQEHGKVYIERSRFIRLLFGRVSPEDMSEEFSMYYFKNEDYRNIFEILFPKMQSHVLSIN